MTDTAQNLARNIHAPGSDGLPYAKVLDRLAQDLIGPMPGERALTDFPTDSFVSGILFAKGVAVPEEDEPDTAEGANNAEDRAPDRAIRIDTAHRPSVAGLSFALRTEADLWPEIDITISGARYCDTVLEKPEGGGVLVWTREAVSGRLNEIDLQAGTDDIDLGARLDPAFEGLFLKLVVLPRPVAGAAMTETLVTAAVYNRGGSSDKVEGQEGSRIKVNRDAFFEFQMTVDVRDGSWFVARPMRFGRDDEEGQAANLIWRDAVEYAVGHTCSADWSGDPVTQVSTRWFPATHVCATHAAGDESFASVRGRLAAAHLANDDDNAVFASLRALVSAYRDWIDGQAIRVTNEIPHEMRAMADAHLSACTDAACRIDSGIQTLAADPALMTAFRLANRAMALQQDWKSRNTPQAERRPLVWRPFQLAFVLLSLASTADATHDEREVMDLIWFPTGGGKTEAYLLLTAFTIFARRLQRGEAGHGVAAIMRYTLRLLTIQQFERAAAMICAADTIWRRDEAHKQETRISLGLWLGAATTPNNAKQSERALQVNAEGHETPIQLVACPCCGSTLKWSMEGDETIACCVDTDCVLGVAGPLPLSTVDSDVYLNQPSLVIGTVDKFSQIVRSQRTASLFGDDMTDPPDLIIQDELHLISGPLGTQVGLFETAIDALCTRDGHPPKVIGSTATIRRAEAQVKALFNRTTFQFPPPGIDSKNSGFAVEDPSNQKGRLYVGVTTAGHSKPHVLQAVCASLLQSADDTTLSDTERDACWTMLAYFNSLRELGGSVTLLQSITTETMALYASARGEHQRQVGEQIEVTSRIPSGEIKDVLAQLERPAASGEAVDVALATNMISVGVDIGRLGLMVMDGQPKGISEYIQATSRVGRGDVPGLVVGVFNAYNTRDRSRYETHRTWHEALYRDVEATSVTPFAPRARDRALHAPLVALAAHRNTALWDHPDRARDNRDALEEIAAYIVARVTAVDAPEAAATSQALTTLIDTWCNRDLIKTWWDDGGETSLLMSSEWAAQRKAAKRGEKQAWPTPNSMRGVEATVAMVLQEKT